MWPVWNVIPPPTWPVLAGDVTFRSALKFFFFFFFFFKFFWGPLVRLFWISGVVSSGVQRKSGLCLIRYFCGGKCNVHSPRSPLVLHLPTSWWPAHSTVLSPHTVAEVRLPGFEFVLSEYLWARRSTNWAKPGPTALNFLDFSFCLRGTYYHV